MKKIIQEGILEHDSTEDSGRSLQGSLEIKDGDDLEGLFFVVHSWSENPDPKDTEHDEFRKLVGKKVRITLEILEN
jgi:hypothetical protein